MRVGRCVVVLLAICAAGCHGPWVPSAPSPPPNVPAVPPPDRNSAGAAVLEVVSFAVVEYRGAWSFQYSTALQLKEVGGKSGVTISSLRVSVEGGTSDSDCLPQTVRIEPGGTWNIGDLGYCAPYAQSPTAVSRATFQAVVRDDLGTIGALVMTADVKR